MHGFHNDSSGNLSRMDPQLELIFQELGISQYLQSFLEQGFDSWDTILDITESDLDVLGVKLGHRRKLQRRIANSRGIAPDVALGSPTNCRPNQEDRAETSQDSVKGTTTKDGGVTKRKYRRHPKPDENAPERPPSAYVLFSNKMRDGLKGRNLTFTEIAKLVGENWQALTPTEKEPYESRAQLAKDKYISEMNQYKKTAEYQQYMQYLHEFRLKHPSSNPQDKDSQKRPKLGINPQPLHTSNVISPAVLGGDSSRGSGSGESYVGNDSLSLHRQTLMQCQQQQPHLDLDLSSVSSTPLSCHTNLDEPLVSPDTSYGPRLSEHPEHYSPKSFHQEIPYDQRIRHLSSWRDKQLPPLLDMLDKQPPTSSFTSTASEGSKYLGCLQNRHRSGPGPPGTLSPSIGENRAPPMSTLRQEYSTTRSMSSGSGTAITTVSMSASTSATTVSSSNSGSSSSTGTPNQNVQPSYTSASYSSAEASLPINALLHTREGARPDIHSQRGSQLQFSNDHSLYHRREQLFSRPSNVLPPSVPVNFGASHGFNSSPYTSTTYPCLTGGNAKTEVDSEDGKSSVLIHKKELDIMDGMSALVRAGEIVDHRA